jgi:hypothetical protein
MWILVRIFSLFYSDLARKTEACLTFCSRASGKWGPVNRPFATRPMNARRSIKFIARRKIAAQIERLVMLCVPKRNPIVLASLMIEPHYN